jgi:hypothetical protein
MFDKIIDVLAEALDTSRKARNFLNYLAGVEPMLLTRLLTRLLGMASPDGEVEDSWRPTCDPAFQYVDSPTGLAIRCNSNLLSPDHQADGRPTDYAARLRAVHDWLKEQGILSADAPIDKSV